jgi:hypothetical protein
MTGSHPGKIIMPYAEHSVDISADPAGAIVSPHDHPRAERAARRKTT